MAKALSYIFWSFSRRGFIENNQVCLRPLIPILRDKNSAPLIIQIEGTTSGGKTLIVDTYKDGIYEDDSITLKESRVDHLHNRDFELYHGVLRNTETSVTLLFNAPNISRFAQTQPLHKHIFSNKRDHQRKLADIYILSNLDQTRLNEQVDLYKKHHQQQWSKSSTIRYIKPDIRIDLKAFGPLSWWIRKIEVHPLSPRAQQALYAAPPLTKAVA
jgi:hypothetical protein